MKRRWSEVTLAILGAWKAWDEIQHRRQFFVLPTGSKLKASLASVP